MHVASWLPFTERRKVHAPSVHEWLQTNKTQLSMEANFFNQQGEVEQILEEATPLKTVEAKKPN